MLDVPAAHIKVVGAIAARALVLGLGGGQRVTLQPPETAPEVYYPPGENPVYARLTLQQIARPTLEELPLIGFAAALSTRFTVEGPTTMAR